MYQISKCIQVEYPSVGLLICWFFMFLLINTKNKTKADEKKNYNTLENKEQQQKSCTR